MPRIGIHVPTLGHMVQGFHHPTEEMAAPTYHEIPSASQKALRLPELVLPMIKDLAVGDLHSAALVCQVWSEIALDYLWRAAVSLAPLLNTLAPMQYSEEDKTWTFTKNLDQANWLRFHAYSRRIRIVEACEPKERWSRPVSENSLETVQASMPPWCHFPRPTRVSYDAVYVTSALVAPSLHNFLCSVSTSMKELDVFDTDFIAGNTDDSRVQDFFRRIGELEASCLEPISVQYPFYFSRSPSFPNLIKRHASTLSVLRLGIPFSDLLWTAVQDLRNLKQFSIDLDLACDPLTCPRDSLTALGDLTSGPLLRLEEFTLSLSQLDIDAEQRLLPGMFRCIGRMTELRSLTLMSNIPIMPHASKMLDMGRDLCQLQALRVDITRIRVRGDDIETLSYLIPILQIFPHLRRLDIRIVCRLVPDAVHTEVHSLLEILDVSWSPAPKAKLEDVAVFLRSVLPRRARVVHAGADSSFRVDSGKVAWAEIARLVSEA